MISVTSKGDLKKTNDFLKSLQSRKMYTDLHKYGKMGVEALARATPVESSLTANSWEYRIFKGKRSGIVWYNTNTIGDTSVAILLQYGHATGTGGYVPGRDYINPAMKPIFDQISDNVWKKVKA